ncbi:hypothetical protein TNCV_5061681 [Trichonephila clavipes]|nr:hypothetical protein TNCV_5061681 [Trichonephila clavipes]
MHVQKKKKKKERKKDRKKRKGRETSQYFNETENILLRGCTTTCSKVHELPLGSHKKFGMRDACFFSRKKRSDICSCRKDAWNLTERKEFHAASLSDLPDDFWP